MSINVWTDPMQHAELFGKPVLSTNWLILRDLVPKGWHCYDLQGTQNNPNGHAALVDRENIFHTGTILSPQPLKREGTVSRRVNGSFHLLGEEMTLEQFCEKHDLEYPQDTREFILRPASPDEAGLFYSMDAEEDRVLGTVGHLRIDFGHGGKEFWHTWWPHNDDQFNTPEFKDILQRFVDSLRQDGPLKDLKAMSTYCWQHGGPITEDKRSYGYLVEVGNYRLCLRCTPVMGDYQGYLYCYDLHQQELAQHRRIIGKATFTNGDQKEFTSAREYLQMIWEELPDRNITGFRFETLTDDPEVKKAVDDILLDFGGEGNPRRTCNYGLAEEGKRQLQAAAEPGVPHQYEWFVITEINTPKEQHCQELTLEDAIQTYEDSPQPEKRLGVTKNGIATVDLVCTCEGEQRFFEDYKKLASFREDPVIATAVERIHEKLGQDAPCQEMQMGGM